MTTLQIERTTKFSDTKRFHTVKYTRCPKTTVYYSCVFELLESSSTKLCKFNYFINILDSLQGHKDENSQSITTGWHDVFTQADEQPCTRVVFSPVLM